MGVMQLPVNVCLNQPAWSIAMKDFLLATPRSKDDKWKNGLLHLCLLLYLLVCITVHGFPQRLYHLLVGIVMSHQDTHLPD